MASGALLGFWGVSILLVITPGADWAHAIAAGVRSRSPVPAVAGMLLGHLTATAAVAAGVGALLARAPHVMTALTVAGAAYLGWLGVGMLRRAGSPESEPGAAPAALLPQVARGFGVSAMNPKVFLLFLAVLPQFADAGAGWPLGWQMAALGLVHVASCAVVYLAVGFGARRVLSARPAAAHVVTRVSGAIMVVIAVLLLVERFAQPG